MGQLVTIAVVSLMGAFLVGGLARAQKSLSFGPWRSALLGVVVFLLLLGAQMGAASAVRVEAGTVALVTQSGEVVTVFQPGLHFKLPFVQETVVYRTGEIIYATSATPASSDADYPDYEMDTATIDGQPIIVRFTVRFRIDIEQVSKIWLNLGTERDMVEKVVKANARVRARNIIKRYPAADLYASYLAAEAVVAEALRADYELEGIELLSFEINSIQFSKDYVNSVQE